MNQLIVRLLNRAQHPSAGRNIPNHHTGRRVLRYYSGPNLSKFVSCVLVFTFEFQILATPYLQSTTLGTPVVGLAVKHRQWLAMRAQGRRRRGVGVVTRSPSSQRAAPPSSGRIVFALSLCMAFLAISFLRYNT